MIRRTSLAALTLALIAGLASAQPPTPQPPSAFVAADVHVSTPMRFPWFERLPITGDRYLLNEATMLDLITTAYGVDPANVQGGPAWLERNRFDVDAKIPSAAAKDATKPMLQALLADRFKLVTHTEPKPMPAYMLIVTKSGSKLKPAADDTAPSGCDFKPPPPGASGPNYLTFACHNITMEGFAENVHDWAQWSGGYLPNPVIDATGLKGGFDFEVKWSNRGDLTKQGPDGIPLTDAVEKQLGLKLELQTAPRPVIVVDSVNDKPTPNVAGLDKIMPPLPPAALEVATIKPAKPGAQQNWRINPSEINIQNASLRDIIDLAWELNNNDKEVPVGAPKWLDSEKFDILAKIANDAGVKNPPLVPFAHIRELLRQLLTERFQMKTHMEERIMEGYQLVAVNPKLKKADPTARTTCKEGPGADGKDPRIANPILGRLLTCTDMTMPQFAEELQQLASGYIYNSVVDATGLEGGYDFTLSFSTAGQLGTGPDSSAPDGAASVPNGALSLLDALPKELGLKLVKIKRPMLVLVIDHIEPKPTED